MNNDLAAATYDFIQRLDICFGDGDCGHTEATDFQTIANALLGKHVGNGPGCNLDNLANASKRLRETLVMAINAEIRHEQHGIRLL